MPVYAASWHCGTVLSLARAHTVTFQPRPGAIVWAAASQTGKNRLLFICRKHACQQGPPGAPWPIFTPAVHLRWEGCFRHLAGKRWLRKSVYIFADCKSSSGVQLQGLCSLGLLILMTTLPLHGASPRNLGMLASRSRLWSTIAAMVCPSGTGCIMPAGLM